MTKVTGGDDAQAEDLSCGKCWFDHTNLGGHICHICKRTSSFASFDSAVSHQWHQRTTESYNLGAQRHLLKVVLQQSFFICFVCCVCKRGPMHCKHMSGWKWSESSTPTPVRGSWTAILCESALQYYAEAQNT